MSGLCAVIAAWLNSTWFRFELVCHGVDGKAHCAVQRLDIEPYKNIPLLFSDGDYEDMS